MFGTTLTFTAAADADLSFVGSRPSREQCVVIGMNYYNAANDDNTLDQMLNEYGPVLIRRSLRAFANYASRTGQSDVSKFAYTLRDDIKVVPANAKTA